MRIPPADRRSFRLIRQIPGPDYRFRWQGKGYRRRDRDLWIIWDKAHGWIAPDPVTGAIQGRPLEVALRDQTNFPPPGIWISRKGAKSYVYTLDYL